MKASQRRLDIVTRCDIVLHLVDEWCIRNPPRVAGRSILPAGNCQQADCTDESLGSVAVRTWRKLPVLCLSFSLPAPPRAHARISNLWTTFCERRHFVRWAASNQGGALPVFTKSAKKAKSSKGGASRPNHMAFIYLTTISFLSFNVSSLI